MGTVHELIANHGKQTALNAVLDRNVVEAAASYLGDENNGIGFVYSGWCQAALPHKRLADDKGWQIESERVTLIVEPGMRAGSHGTPQSVGVPYGSRARLIMLYLQSEALRTQSREIELGSSLRHWLERLGISTGGKSIAGVREQAERISRCRLTLEIRIGTTTGLINQNIVDSAIFLDQRQSDGKQSSLFTHAAKLSEGFYDQLNRHSVPLEEAAIRAINNNSMALDLYSWLAYRLHVLERSRDITWSALKQQFGNGFSKTSHFKEKFVPNLRLALAVYPKARIDIAEKTGLTLHPSPPPVAPSKGSKQARLAGI